MSSTSVLIFLPAGDWLSHNCRLSTRPHSTRLKSSQSQNYVMTEGQSASLSWCQAPIWALRPDFYYRETVAIFLMWDALSDERMGLPFTIVAGPRQHNHSRAQDGGKDSRLPPLGAPGSRIYIPQEQFGPVIPPGTGFRFRRLLRLAGLQWRYSNPPTRGVTETEINSVDRVI
jgi:hypothetical protein